MICESFSNLYMLYKYLLVVIVSTLFHIWRVLLFIGMCCPNICAGTYLISKFHIAPLGGELSARRFTAKLVRV